MIGAPKDLCVQKGFVMLNQFEALSTEFYEAGFFHPTPKTHALVHIVLEAQSAKFVINPWLDCCWMDEDFIGRVCRKIVRQMDPRTVLTGGVERYLALMRTEIDKMQQL